MQPNNLHHLLNFCNLTVDQRGMFVYLLAGLCKGYSKFGGNVAHCPWKKPLDSGGNQDHVMLGLELQLGCDTAILHVGGYALY